MELWQLRPLAGSLKTRRAHDVRNSGCHRLVRLGFIPCGATPRVGSVLSLVSQSWSNGRLALGWMDAAQRNRGGGATSGMAWAVHDVDPFWLGIGGKGFGGIASTRVEPTLHDSNCRQCVATLRRCRMDADRSLRSADPFTVSEGSGLDPCSRHHRTSRLDTRGALRRA